VIKYEVRSLEHYSYMKSTFIFAPNIIFSSK